MNLEKRVEGFIAQHRLFSSDARLLLAISGGADSVALLRMLVSLGYRCHVVHCNFHLRGEESNRDESFVVHLCSSLDVSYDVLNFDTVAYASEHRLSIEMAARELRYKEFERIRKAGCFDAIVVAHHQDDAVETLLLNLIRGAGINGLTGMKIRNGYVVRPLLCMTRSEVLAYLAALGQDYVTDSTNLTDVYARNKIRLRLIPLMQEINPRAADNIAHAATNLADVATIYNRLVTEEAEHVTVKHPDGLDIVIEPLLASAIPHSLLFEILSPYGFNSKQTTNIFRSLTVKGHGVGCMYYTRAYSLVVDRSRLLLRHLSCDVDEHVYELPVEGLLNLSDGSVLKVERIIPDERWQVSRTPDVCVINAALIEPSLTVRKPKKGDRMRPFGMRGSKLLSDIYTDNKLSRIAKQQQWLLCRGDEIIWAIGIRTSELCRLRGDETEVVQISLLQ